MITVEEEAIPTPAVVTSHEDNLPPVHCTYVTAQVPHGKLKVTKGILNEREVTVLLDCGADSIFIAKRLVSPEDYTGETRRTRTATQVIPGCPVARINFRCPYYDGGETCGVVLDDPPYDVLLGKVRGTSSFEEEPPRVFQPPVHPDLPIENSNAEDSAEATARPESEREKDHDTTNCQVMTRSQQKAAQPLNPDDVLDSPISNDPCPSVPSKPLPNAQEFGQAQRDCPSLRKLRLQARSKTESYERGGAMSQIKEDGGVFTRIYLRNGIQQEQLLVPTQFRKEVLQLAHENPLSGHFGIDKTKERIQREFYWPQMEQDVKSFVLQCTTCCLMTPRRPAKVPLGTPALAFFCCQH